ncbi:MAG: sigma-70 family RNA polymerase sigma factor [Clostridia bacterium]|nr:sigma-70 family RNA polymerase sigma factor [Clostridia bacterium]
MYDKKKLLNLLRKVLSRPKNRWQNGTVWYLEGSPSLPPPMTRAEEEACFAAIRRGDEAAREQLIVRNLRLVVYIAKKFDASATPLEDLISIGTIGLIKAVRTFDPDKKIKLATYASRCVENEILMHLRKLASRGQEVSIDEPLNFDPDGNELLLSDILSSSPDEISAGVESEDEIRLLMRCVARLSDRERQIVCMRFGLAGSREYTQKQVADALGISQSYISRIEKKILTTLKSELDREMREPV